MPQRRGPVARLLPAVGAAAGLLALSGCVPDGTAEGSAAPAAASTATPAPRTTYTAEVPVLVPGRPGEPAATVEPGGTGSYADPMVYGEADVTFVRDMIVHHEQALEMAALAPERASDDAVRRLAERIRAAQGPEIDALQGWLEAQGLPGPRGAAPVDVAGSAQAGPTATGGDAGHQGMHGMASEQALAALAAARGEDFDRRFLEMMIAHHEGALRMVQESGLEATNAVVQDVVADVAVTQGVEIERMREVLAGL